jgi:predicted Zn-ribbon and HTH transcriptional regulator
MVYTNKIKKAIRFSIETHEVDQKQKRKGKDIAYVTHPLTVGMILSLAGVDEDTVIAGILHDTIEDSTTEKKVTKEILEEQFGSKVAELVLSVTEQNKEISWEERKIEALKHIDNFSNNSVLVKSGDVISNSTELIDDYEIENEVVFERFNAPKDKILMSSLRVINRLVTKWPESPLASDLLSIAKDLQMIGAPMFMTSYPAKIVEYSDYNENINIDCPICNWKGTPKSSGWIDTDSEYSLNVHCPICEKMLVIASYASAQ